MTGEIKNAMDEYLCLTLLSLAGETEADFKRRLSELWTIELRKHESDYEKVYAETSAFGRSGKRLSRQYLVEAAVAESLAGRMRAMGIDCEPVDVDEVYSKFEAAPPEWFWIEH